MRTIINLPDKMVAPLAHLCQEKKISRAELIRRALENYIEKQMLTEKDEAFGLWKKHKVDALKHEDHIRSEWSS